MIRTRHLLPKLALTLLVIAALGLVFLDARITATFSDKMWELPAKVYARPLELFVGAAVTPFDLEYELPLAGYRSVRVISAPGQFSRYGDRMEIYTRGFPFADGKEPAWRVRLDFRHGRITGMSAGGKRLDLMRLDPVQIGGIYPQHGEDRILVRLADVPDTLRDGLLAIEDKNFYSHWGFSVRGILRAAFSNLRSGQVVAGGSTITQQLVKNYYLTPERTVVRKVIELVMAVLLELHYDKEMILESYLNEVYLGQEGPRSIHGFALAARHYFDTPLDQLGLHQQALLVGMIKGPSLYNPLRNPERARERRNLVLDVMAAEGVISEEHAAVAGAMPLGINRESHIQNSYPAYLELVRRQLRQDYRDEDLTTKGLQIFTSFDPLLQRVLERSTGTVLDRLDPEGGLQSAAVVTRFDSGEVVAMVGGRKARFAGFNRALDARRPAGSLLKPAIYLAALEDPARFNLATVLSDTPLTVGGKYDEPWTPRNFDRQPHGDVLLYRALANSYNLATARLGMALGIDRVVETLSRLGVEEGVPRVPALMLGAGEYSPMAMAAMYQSIAAGGFRTPLRSIRDVVDAQGDSLKRYPLQYDSAVSPQAVRLLHFALQAVVREGTGKTVYNYLPEDFSVAGKTGTTNDGRDSWFAGFSGDLLAVTWIGRDDNSGTGLTGSTGALKLWGHFMANASGLPMSYNMPDGMTAQWVDVDHGYLTGVNCPNSLMLPFIEGSEPRERGNCSGRRAGGGPRDWFERLFGGR